MSPASSLIQYNVSNTHSFAEMAEGGEQDPVVVEDDPTEEWQDIRLQNPAEALHTMTK